MPLTRKLAKKCRTWATSSLDPWWAVQDLWLRLDTLVPVTVEASDWGRRLRVSGLRRADSADVADLLPFLLDHRTYELGSSPQRCRIVHLIAWDQDDLLLDLAAPGAIARWPDGDVLINELADLAVPTGAPVMSRPDPPRTPMSIAPFAQPPPR